MSELSSASPTPVDSAAASDDSDDELLNLLAKAKQQQEQECGSGGGCCGGKQARSSEFEGALARGRKQYREQLREESVSRPQLTFWQKMKKMASFLTLVAVCLLFLVLKSGEDQWYSRRHLDVAAVDHYEVLGVSRKDSTATIRRKFRRLAAQWHPDKHPDCDVCVEKFTAIQEAFDVLSDPTKRGIYDGSNSVNLDTIRPVFTQVITAENYDTLVRIPLNDMTRKAPVWLVMVHSDLEYHSTKFFSLFEALAEQLTGFVKFGVVDALRDKASVKKLPIHIRVHPTILLLRRNHRPIIMPMGEITGLGSLRQWVHANMPDNYRSLRFKREFLDFYECGKNDSGKPRLLLVRQSKEVPMMFSSSLESWDQVFDIATAPAEIVPKEYRKIVAKDSAQSHTLLALPACGSGSDTTYLRRLLVNKKHWIQFKGLVSEAATSFSMELTKRTAEQLCSSSTGVRTYCVVLIKPQSPPESLLKALTVHNEATYRTWRSLEEVEPSTDLAVFQAVHINEASDLLLDFQAEVLKGAEAFILDWDAARLAVLEDDSGDAIPLEDVASAVANGVVNFKSFASTKHRCGSPQAFVNCLVGDEPWTARLVEFLRQPSTVLTFLVVIGGRTFCSEFGFDPTQT